tara:strand:+ start:539 stop:823 length:285 start_codon:yes stop_codon:yes gene_type:complete
MAKQNLYDVGDLVRLTGTFKDINGTLHDPTAVVLEITDPAGTKTTPTPTNSSVGVYDYDLDLNQEGRWLYRFSATGTGQAAEENTLVARAKQTA